MNSPARSPSARLVCVAILLLAFAGSGCGGAPEPRSRVVRGEEWMGAALVAMQSQGVVFAPYNEPSLLGAEQTHAHYKCIEAINHAVLVALTSRYAVRPPRRRAGHAGARPSLQGPSGPRVAVHVQAFRCGLVTGDGTYTAVASGDPGGAEVVRGEVVLVVHDRSTGEPIIDVRAEAVGPDGLAAARSAADVAVRKLLPDG